MEITGRLVADATVRAVSENKNVTGFRVAINRRYKSQGEQKEETSLCGLHLLAGWRYCPLSD
jgi:single-strand DNA-binding protein